MSEERRSCECDPKITGLAQRIDRVEQDIKVLFQKHDDKENKFDKHVDKEEILWRELREDLSNGMEAIRSELHELVKGALNSRLDLEREIASKYVSKEAARLVWGVILAVVVASNWFFSNYGAQQVGHRHTVEMRDLAKTIVDEINKHEVVPK